MVGRKLNWRCEDCDVNFTRKDAHKRHMETKHGGRALLTCTTCRRQFKRRDKLALHRRTHMRQTHDGETVARRKEEVNVVSTSKCVVENKDNHGDESMDDDDDDDGHSSTSAMSSLSETSTSSSPPPASSPHTTFHTCTQCPTSSFLSVEEWRHHNETLHPGMKFYDCETCERTFEIRRQYKNHNCSENPRKEPDGHLCTVCGKKFKRLSVLVRHVANSHNIGARTYTCHHCDKPFGRRDVLLRHITTQHFDKTFDCGECGKSYKRRDDLNVHIRRGHEIDNSKSHNCCVCEKKFTSRKRLLAHQKGCKDTKDCDEGMHDDVTDKDQPHSSDHASLDSGWTSESSLGGDAVMHTINIEDVYDLNTTLRTARGMILSRLGQDLSRMQACKWYLTAGVDVCPNDDSKTERRHLRCTNKTLLREHAKEGLTEQVEMAIMEVLQMFDRWLAQGSAMVLEKVCTLQLSVAMYRPLGGSSYLPLPEWLSNPGKGLINIQNENDEKCFLWSVILGEMLFTNEVVRGKKCRVQNYVDKQNRFDMSGIQYPVSVTQVTKFEKQNPRMSVNVFGLQNNRDIVPLRITTKSNRIHVNLLLLSDWENGGCKESHYVLISDKSKLFSHLNKHRAKMYWCDYCLHAFTTIGAHNAHRKECLVHGPQKTSLPELGRNILRFTDISKQLRHDYVIYADIESVLMPLQLCMPNPTFSRTTKTSVHVPCGFSLVIIGPEGKPIKPPIVYHGTSNVIREFLLCIESEVDKIKDLRVKYDINWKDENQKKDHEKAEHCYLCKVQFVDRPDADAVKGKEKARVPYKCADHDHTREKNNYRGALCNPCNLNLKKRDFVPCFFHNLKNYDAHLILQEIGSLINQKKDLNVIPKTKEKYISFQWKKIRFLDSLQFLPSSLDKLASDLSENETKILNSEIQCDVQRKLLRRKGVYPYEYFSDFDVFNETSLPPKSAFYSSLKQENVSDQDYQHAMDVWEAFKMQNLWDFHDVYLKTDVLLLADVMENFRGLSMSYYGLDPAHFYTTPGLAWSAALLKTGVEIELLTDIDMHLFVEKGIRGGVAVINHRFCEANNKYISENFDPSKPIVYILYLDANNLYGTSMSEPLPTGGFRWLSENEIKMFDVKKIKKEDNVGFMLEVDLEVPSSIHDFTNDFPLAPEHFEIRNSMLSPYQINLQNGCAPPSVKKLVPNLYDKKKYVVYGTTLVQYLQLGLRLTKIHRVLEFRQSAWLKPYVDFNTKKRQEATSSFAKNFFKLMVNSSFGKTIEGVREKKNVYFCKKRAEFRKLVSKPTFHSFDIFDHKLIAVECKKQNIKLDKPIFVGMVVLDVSKEIMFQFHYGCMKKMYGDRCMVMGGDTDSLFYKIETEDVYEDMKNNLKWFDTSDYPQNHFLHSDVNKKVLGKFKDEMNGEPILKYSALRAKMYAFVTRSMKEKKVAKGIDRNAVQKKLTVDDYISCLKNKTSNSVSFNKIGSDGKHHVYTMNVIKKGLSCYDDKRYILDDGIQSLAHGHFKISHLPLLDDDMDEELSECLENVEKDEGSENLDMLISLLDE